MIPIEKASEIFNSFRRYAYDGASSLEENAKECAKICVNEIIKASPNDFWIEVLKEIENL